MLGFLRSPRDLARVQCLNRQLRGLAGDNALWGPLLHAAFDILVEARRAEGLSLRDIYRDLQDCIDSYYVRFQGAYTDGGTDKNAAYYWSGPCSPQPAAPRRARLAARQPPQAQLTRRRIDNMFMPNNWAFHCRRGCAGALARGWQAALATAAALNSHAAASPHALLPDSARQRAPSPPRPSPPHTAPGRDSSTCLLARWSASPLPCSDPQRHAVKLQHHRAAGHQRLQQRRAGAAAQAVPAAQVSAPTSAPAPLLISRPGGSDSIPCMWRLLQPQPCQQLQGGDVQRAAPATPQPAPEPRPCGPAGTPPTQPAPAARRRLSRPTALLSGFSERMSAQDAVQAAVAQLERSSTTSEGHERAAAVASPPPPQACPADHPRPSRFRNMFSLAGLELRFRELYHSLLAQGHLAIHHPQSIAGVERLMLGGATPEQRRTVSAGRGRGGGRGGAAWRALLPQPAAQRSAQRCPLGLQSQSCSCDAGRRRARPRPPSHPTKPPAAQAAFWLLGQAP
jgi:hypothetical protein